MPSAMRVNNLTCASKSTEFRTTFWDLSTSARRVVMHGWTLVRVQRVGAKDSEFNAAFLEKCEEVSFINVGGSLRAKVLICQAIFLTPISARTQIIQRLATNLS